MTTEIPYIHQLICRSFLQAAACAGSAGQGALRFFHCKTPAVASMMPATAKTAPLCADSQISCGTVLTRPAKAAPAPKVTNRAGSAQQIKVLTLVMRLKPGTSRDFLLSSSMLNALSGV